eukprot:gene46499-62195_t
MTTVVSLKYVLLILRADNNGEGGLIAMLALATTAVKDRPVLRRRLMVIGLFGTAIFYGDGVITPAISVLSAVEGLEVAAPALHHFVIPITLLVLTALFAVQRFGTGGIGKFFGPITLVWFFVLIALGLPHILDNPDVLVALNPAHAVGFFAGHPLIAFIALGAVVLCVTGGEALYADMGHFGRLPIRIAWYSLVMPALVVNYFGQGAMLLRHPEAVTNPFYMMAPDWARLPLVFLATAATVCGLGLPSVMMLKECVNEAFESGLSSGVRYERRAFHALFGTDDQREGMDAFLNKRKAAFTHR